MKVSHDKTEWNQREEKCSAFMHWDILVLFSWLCNMTPHKSAVSHTIMRQSRS